MIGKLFRKYTTGRSPGAEAPPTHDAELYWDNWRKQDTEHDYKWSDWTAHPTILKLINNKLFGAPDTSVFQYLKAGHPELSGYHGISLCSGDGNFERKLIEKNIVKSIDGIDISQARVDYANNVNKDLAERLEFYKGDVNSGEFQDRQYDLLLAKSALHHIENLELVFEKANSVLSSSGTLLTIDFFGPTRFQWSKTQLELANDYLSTRIPEELRMQRNGKIKTDITRPTIDEMIALDPSEAVRSSEIHSFVQQYFPRLEEMNFGGTLLQLIFTPEILENFDPENAMHNDIITDAFNFENQLIEDEIIDSDFKLIIASK